MTDPGPVRASPAFPPAQTFERSSVERSPVETPTQTSTGHGNWIGRMILRAVLWPMPIVFVVAVVYVFFGETTVKATLDGKPVHAQVWVNGEYVHDTPYTARLGFGRFKVEVLPPDGSDTDTSAEVLLFWSVVRGTSFNADFETMKPDNEE